MIAKYIVELLKDNSRVIIPNLGAFMAKHKPDADANSKELKDKIISFNDFLKYNDGLLVNHIITIEKVSKDEAQKKIKEFVATIDKEIRAGKKFEIKGLGEIFLDDRGGVKFIAGSDSPVSKTTKSTKTSVAAKKTGTAKKEETKKTEKKPTSTKKDKSKFEIDKKEEITKAKVSEKLKTEKPSETIKSKNEIVELKSSEKIVNKDTMNKNVVKSTPPKSPVTSQKPTASDKTAKIVMWSAIGVGAAIIVVLVILNFSTIKKWVGIDKKEVKVENVVPVISAEEQHRIDSIKEVKAKAIAIADSIKAAEAEKARKLLIKDYHLVAGAFKIESNAKGYEQTLQNQGCNAKFVGKKGSFNIVVYDSYATKKEAMDNLRITKNKGLDVWYLNYKFN